MSAELGEYARRVVSGWPPLTSEQREGLARLLCPGGKGSTQPAKPPMTAEERARVVELLRPTARRRSTGGAA